MGVETKIEWCDATLNLWWGCTKVSKGCNFCYAEHLADGRFNKGNWGPKGIREEKKAWRSNLKEMSKLAKEKGRRLRVFCQSMSDTFEGPETMGGAGSQNWITVSTLRDQLLALIPEHPELDFLLLTKRPENVLRCVEAHENFRQEWAGDYDYRWQWPGNLWIGTSVEDEGSLKRIHDLSEIPAAVRFLSCEPLLGYVPLPFLRQLGIHWVIVGGESGPNARPMDPDWARRIRNQCEAEGVTFFFKQWGEWLPLDQVEHNHPDWTATELNRFDWDKPTRSFRVGKKAAGRLLDGREWSEVPR